VALNYTAVTYVNGALTINKAATTSVTASSGSITYGTALPTIEVNATKVKGSYTVTGLTKGVSYTITVAAENQFGMSVEAKTTVKVK
jgi:hypothetical protein